MSILLAAVELGNVVNCLDTHTTLYICDRHRIISRLAYNNGRCGSTRTPSVRRISPRHFEFGDAIRAEVIVAGNGWRDVRLRHTHRCRTRTTGRIGHGDGIGGGLVDGNAARCIAR